MDFHANKFDAAEGGERVYRPDFATGLRTETKKLKIFMHKKV